MLELQWTTQRCIDFAEREEPERIPFWRRYYADYGEACRAVAENTPNFDRMFAEQFPKPGHFRRLVRAEKPGRPIYRQRETYVTRRAAQAVAE